MASRYDLLSGTTDSVNRTFTLPVGRGYVSGSLTLIHNGLTIHRTDTNGFTEVDSNTILLNNAPDDGDVLACFYEDGTVENTVIDIEVSGNTLNFETDWNASQFQIEYSVSLSKVQYNTSNYSLEYNTNSFTIGED